MRARFRAPARAMTKLTVLNALHRALGARMVDFGGWDMPIHYGSQLDEHHAVRGDAGMFDVSHMTVVDLRGDHVRAFLRRLLANNVDKLRTRGKALYTCMLNKAGGTDTEKMIATLADMKFDTIVGPVTMRNLDHQSTLGAWVGETTKQGKMGTMKNWKFEDGAKYLFPEAEVKAARKQ